MKDYYSALREPVSETVVKRSGTFLGIYDPNNLLVSFDPAIVKDHGNSPPPGPRQIPTFLRIRWW